MIHCKRKSKADRRVIKLTTGCKPKFLPDLAKIDRALAAVRAELIRATSKHGPMHSTHEGFGVIFEEVDELLDEVRANNRKRARAEALQVAAMGTRFFIDL
jgi:hypothetical protein